jgi:hypothetical protein
MKRKAEQIGFRPSSFICHPSTFAWLFLATSCAPALADGGSVLLSEKTGDYRVTVFGSPLPFRAGPVDIGVLVQDAITGQPLLRARVTVRMTKIGELALEYPATQDVATNKLLHAAQFELPAPGRWHLEVRVEGLQESAVVACEVEALDRLPRWHSLWPWLGWPILVIALFSIHKLLARRKAAKNARHCDYRQHRIDPCCADPGGLADKKTGCRHDDTLLEKRQPS